MLENRGLGLGGHRRLILETRSVGSLNPKSREEWGGSYVSRGRRDCGAMARVALSGHNMGFWAIVKGGLGLRV